jgi:hypothetical protein
MKSPEGVYIVGFMSQRVHGVQDCVKTMHKAEVGSHLTAKVVDHMAGPLLVLVASPIDFFSSRSSIS